MRHVVAAFAVTRLAVIATILAGTTFLAPSRCPFCNDASANPVLAAFARWDANAYLDIARDGYAALDRSYGAYAPLYPLVVGVGGHALGGATDAYIVAGALVSNVALLVALVLLYRFAAPHVGDDAARRAAIYILVFPTTVILSALYAEPLFLALAIASALDAEGGRWMRSGVLAALAALTRPFGAVAVIPLVFATWRERRHSAPGAWLAPALAPLAFVGWSGYLAARTGDPLDVIHVYGAWGSGPHSPHGAFLDLFDPSVYGFPWVVLGLIVLFATLAVMSWRTIGPAYGTLALVLLAVLSSSGSLTSSTRYELAMYPAFVTLGAIVRRRLAYVVLTSAFGIVAIVFTAMFALWFWIG